METKKNDDIELRSEEFQEIIGAIPPWMLRYGIVTVCAVIILLLVGATLLKYPDVITASVHLTGVNPTAIIVAKSNGKIQQVYVANNQHVKNGDYLALLENTAKMEDVIYIRNFINECIPWEQEKWILPERDLTLGSFQSIYSSYYMALSTYIQFRELDYYKTKIELMERRISQTEKNVRSVAELKRLTEKRIVISDKQYSRDSVLFSRGLIAEVDMETSYMKCLQEHTSLLNAISNYESQQIQLALLYENLYDTRQQCIEKQNELERQLKSLTMQLQTEIKNWELIYVLKSPIDGNVSLSRYWAANQNVTAGELTFTVVPDDIGGLLAKAWLPVARSGKVKVGQNVNIRFSNFPDKEYGLIVGKIRNVSQVSVVVENESCYMVDIALPNGLMTTYRKQLPFVPEMEGTADIITDELSLLERMFLPMKKIMMESLY